MNNKHLLNIMGPAILLAITGLSSVFANHPAQFIWAEQITSQRHVFVYFRYNLELIQEPTEATIHIFADSGYHLFVNGAFVQ